MQVVDTEDGLISRIQKEVQRMRDSEIDRIVEELKSEGFEGDVHMAAIQILSSACLTFAKHVQDTVKGMGGTVTVFPPGGESS